MPPENYTPSPRTVAYEQLLASKQTGTMKTKVTFKIVWHLIQ